MYSAGELRRINYTCTLAGLEAMLSAGPGQPFRFVYMSGEVANEEALKTQKLLATYGKMRVSFCHVFLYPSTARRCCFCMVTIERRPL